MDSLGIAVVLGIVEGLTEFIPVSSTGHLILVGHLLGFVGEKAASFEVAIQLGAILSVVFLYWRRFIELIPTRSAVGSDSTLKGWSGLWRIALATLPALIVGFLARHTIKEQLFTPLAVTWALAARKNCEDCSNRSSRMWPTCHNCGVFSNGIMTYLDGMIVSSRKRIFLSSSSNVLKRFS